MEDQKTGQNLNQFFDLSRRTKELKNASEKFLQRITDETLQLHFTKDHLFHSKYFIFEHVAFTEGDNQRFSVSKAIFNNLKGSTYENINQTLDNYYNMFPRELGVALDQYDNGMVLDIDRFDHFVGEPLIRRYYEQLHQKENQQDQLTQLLKAQAQQSAEQAERQQKHDEMMLKAMEQLAQKEQRPKKQGIWSRLFRSDDD